MCGVVEHGAPASREEIARHEIIGMDGRMALLPGPQWLKAAAPNNESRFSSNRLMNLVYNFRAGLGVATLPCIIGDAEPDLMRCFAPPPKLLSEFWLIVREEVKSAPHVRAFADFPGRAMARGLSQDRVGPHSESGLGFGVCGSGNMSANRTQTAGRAKLFLGCLTSLSGWKAQASSRAAI
jgi:hypothetical protein